MKKLQAVVLGGSLLVALAIAAPSAWALGLPPTESQITSPSDPYQPLYDYDNPGPAPTVSGTSNGQNGTVDINCYLPASSGGDFIHLGALATDANGNFSGPVSIQPASGDSCTMRAVPTGDATVYRPGTASAFAGPRLFDSGISSSPSSANRRAFFLTTSQLGYSDLSAPTEGGLYYSALEDPVTLAFGPQFWNGAGALSTSDAAHPDVVIDSDTAYDAVYAADAHPSASGAPAYSFTNTHDDATGDTIVHEVDPYSKCDDMSCTNLVATGVELDRTWHTSHSGLEYDLTDRWRSTDGHHHSLAATYETAIASDTERAGFDFPGTSGFSTFDKDATVTLPRGRGSILVKQDAGMPDSGGTGAQGAATYSSAPDGPVKFISGDDTASQPPNFTLPYSRTIPAGGAVTLRFAFVQAHTLAEVKSLANGTLAGYVPSLAIAAPADGAHTSSQTVTVSGTAADPTGLSSLTVNGAPTAVASDGSWSRQITLTPGANTITAIATNSDGNSAQLQRTVHYDLPSPAPQPGPAVAALAFHKLRTLADRVRFSLACTGAPCSGDAKLVVKERLKNGHAIGVAKRARTRRVTVGHTRFTIAAGQTKTVTVKLTGRGRKLLRHFHELPATLTVRLNRAGATPSVIKHSRVTFRTPKKKRAGRSG